MTKPQAWLDGRRLLWLGSAIFILFGTAIELRSQFALIDFQAIYYGARCVIQHHDPYKPSEFLGVYQNDGGTFPTEPVAARSVRQAVPICINLPSALFLVAPLALVPWRVAAAIWMLITAASLVLAAFLMWDMANIHAPRLSAGLAFLLLANSELLLVVGNSSGIVVSLCVIAVWCLLRKKFVYLGVACLAVGLVIKPQDTVLIWLFFLLAGGMFRRRALQTAAAALGIAGLAALWVMRVSPHWAQELHMNFAATAVHGGLNDPGPRSLGGHGLGMVVSLQAPLSLLRDSPHFYNPVAWIVCASLIAGWMYYVLRGTQHAHPSSESERFAIAAIAGLAMLPVYHRSYDARLLLLTIPACAMLWNERGRVKWFAALVTVAAILSAGDSFCAAMLMLIKNAPLAARLPGIVMTVIQVFPAPLSLLAVGVFYLLAYQRRCAATQINP